MSNVLTTRCDVQYPISPPKSSRATTKEQDIDASVELATERLFTTDALVAASSSTHTLTVRPHFIIFYINNHINWKPTGARRHSDESRH